MVSWVLDKRYKKVSFYGLKKKLHFYFDTITAFSVKYLLIISIQLKIQINV